MEKWSTRLKDKHRLSSNTIEFSFEKPAGFDFSAGQHVLLKLFDLEYKDERGPIRPFTLSSSPDEDMLKITTRISESGFKKTLINAKSGFELEMMGPRGEFVLIESDYPRVLIAGGIGITPFLSMLKFAKPIESGPIYLYYSNKTKINTVYHSFFETLAKDDPEFNYFPVFTEEDDGQSARLDSSFLQNLIETLEKPSFYICGPPHMVSDLTGFFNPADPIHVYSESFFGY